MDEEAANSGNTEQAIQNFQQQEQVPGKEMTTARADDSISTTLSADEAAGARRRQNNNDHEQQWTGEEVFEQAVAESRFDDTAVTLQFEDPNITQLVRNSLHDPASPDSTEQQPDNTAIDNDNDDDKPPFAMGDHVYRWFNFSIVPFVFQHHAIVLNVRRDENEHDDPDDDTEWILTICDFSRLDDANLAHGSGSSNNKKSSSAASIVRTLISSTIVKGSHSSGDENNNSTTSCLRVYESLVHGWHKVSYGSGLWHRSTARSGTCTAAHCDPPGMVMARTHFLIEHTQVLPGYDVLFANCECVAVWCKTGTWSTLQAASLLAMTAASQAKGAVTMAGVASATQVTVPATGMWGWLGYTTSAPLLAVHPILVPVIVTYGVVTAGVPAVSLMRCKRKWKQHTQTTNAAFWDWAMAHPDLFAERITRWGSQHEPALVGT